VDRPDDLGRAWDQALAAECPCVVEAITDPDVPPLPPHISLAHARKFASTLIKGDPNEAGIIRESMREFFQSVLPHKK
jgi:pyruvate dehydrogenase (quinone)